jgi:hypothetical protein
LELNVSQDDILTAHERLKRLWPALKDGEVRAIIKATFKQRSDKIAALSIGEVKSIFEEYPCFIQENYVSYLLAFGLLKVL